MLALGPQHNDNIHTDLKTDFSIKNSQLIFYDQNTLYKIQVRVKQTICQKYLSFKISHLTSHILDSKTTILLLQFCRAAIKKVEEQNVGYLKVGGAGLDHGHNLDVRCSAQHVLNVGEVERKSRRVGVVQQQAHAGGAHTVEADLALTRLPHRVREHGAEVVAA